MRRPLKLICYDWEIEARDHQLRLVPSWRTFGGSLVAPLVAAVLIGVQVFFFGYPPGKVRMARMEARIDRMEQQFDDVRALDGLLAEGPLGEGERGRPIRQDMEGLFEQQRRALGQERAALERMERAGPTLGPFGDAVYWLAMVLWGLLAVVPPAAAFWERTVISTDGQGGLAVARHGPLGRTHRFPAGTFTAMTIEARHIRYESSREHVQDFGWRWSVRLDVADPRAQRPLVIVPQWRSSLMAMAFSEWTETPPPDPQRLPERVRIVAAFLARATGLRPGPVVQSQGRP